MQRMQKHCIEAPLAAEESERAYSDRVLFSSMNS